MYLFLTSINIIMSLYPQGYSYMAIPDKATKAQDRP